jgi:phage host-nuclease inhibitor protein Gam
MYYRCHAENEIIVLFFCRACSRSDLQRVATAVLAVAMTTASLQWRLSLEEYKLLGQLSGRNAAAVLNVLIRIGLNRLVTS